MPLQKQIIDVPLHTGQDSYSDPKQQKTMQLVHNLLMDKFGRLARRKRFASISGTVQGGVSSPSFLEGTGIFEYESNPIRVGTVRNSGTGISASREGIFHAYIPSISKWTIDNEGGRPYDLTVQRGNQSHIDKDSARSVAQYLNYRAVMFVTGGVPTLEIWDTNTSQLLHTATYASPPTNPCVRCAFVDDPSSANKVLMAVAQGASYNLRVRTWNTGTVDTAPTSEANLAVAQTENATLAHFDVCVVNTGSKNDLIVAYKDSSNRLNIEAITGANASRWTLNYATATYGTPDRSICVFRVRTLSSTLYRIFCGYYDSTGTQTKTVAATAAGASLTATPNTITGMASEGYLLTGAGSFVGSNTAYSDTTGHCVAMIASCDSSSSRVEWARLDATAAISGSISTLTAVHTVGGAFEYQGRIYLTVAPQFGASYFPQFVYIMLEITPGSTTNPVPLGRIFVGNAAICDGTVDYIAPASNVIEGGGELGKFVFAGAEISDILGNYASGGTVFTAKRSLAVVQVDLANNYGLVSWCQSGRDRIVACGRVYLYDGGAQGIPFEFPPFIDDLNSGNTGGGTLAVGSTYYYRSVFSWWDRHGQKHTSGISPTVSQVIGGGENSIVPDGTTGGGALIGDPIIQTEHRVDGYRPILNGSIYYFDELSATTNHIKASIPTALGQADALIEGNEVLYTDTGELENWAPPSSNIVLAHKNRVFLVPMDDRGAIWFSKERQAGVGVSFSAGLIQRIDEGGAIKALASLDDFVVAFKSDSIYAFGGQGPNSQGIGAFSTPQRIATTEGCVDPRSVVSFQDGIVFRGRRGFMLLDRSLQVSFIGTGISGGLDLDVCVAAVPMPALSCLFFVFSTGYIGVYNYLHKMWSYFTIGSVTGTPAHACAVGNDMYLIMTNGNIYQYDIDGTVASSGATNMAEVMTPFVKLEGEQGFQRVWWVQIDGVFPSTGNLTVKLHYDDVNSAVQTIGAINLATAGIGDELRIKPIRQKCKSMAVEVEYDGTGDLSISKISLVCGVKGGKLNRLSGAKTR